MTNQSITYNEYWADLLARTVMAPDIVKIVPPPPKIRQLEDGFIIPLDADPGDVAEFLRLRDIDPAAARQKLNAIWNKYNSQDAVKIAAEICAEISGDNAAEAATGAVRAGEFTTYQDFVDRSVVGDGLEGHELWQHSNMNEMGLTSTRLSTPASQMNPVIVLEREIHAAVNAAQKAFDPRAMTPVQNINLNAQIMMDLKAAPPSVIEAARRAALEHAGNYGY
jgi:hypothetical protein